MSDGLLLRDCLLTHQPTFLMMAGSDPSTIDTLPQPLQRIVADMHAVLHVVFEERRKFDDVTSIERRRLLVALGRISGGRTTSETKVVAGAHRAREILDSLADEFVLSDVRHQYGSDGSHSDAQTFVTALTAFYPDWAFGLGEVVQLDRHGPILALRSVNARFILMTSVWMASYLADEQVQDRDVQVIRAFLENTVFRTPPRGSVHTQPMHVRFDPQRGGVFAEFDETSGSNTVVFKMLPRFIYNEELDRYIRVHLEFRELKSSASAMRKRLMGRGQVSSMAFGLEVRATAKALKTPACFGRVLCTFRELPSVRSSCRSCFFRHGGIATMRLGLRAMRGINLSSGARSRRISLSV